MKLTISNLESLKTQKKLQISNEKVDVSGEVQADIGPLRVAELDRLGIYCHTKLKGNIDMKGSFTFAVPKELKSWGLAEWIKC
jgi:hypothetical protein